MELKVFLFWIVFTLVTWVATKIHYWVSDTGLNWKYFKEDYSSFGVVHLVSLYFGCVVIPIYLIIIVGKWWFS